MTTYRETQWNAARMLLCTGDTVDVHHAAPLPNVRSADGVTGDLRCEECGSPMILVDVLTIDRAPTLSLIAYDRTAPLYTTAKLHPLAFIAGSGA